MTVQANHLIGGEWIAPVKQAIEIINPADGETVVSRCEAADAARVEQAVNAAAAAFPSWSSEPVVKRCRLLFHCKELLEQRLQDVATMIVKENGKTLPEAIGDVRRGIEVLEYACGMPELLKGEWLGDIAGGIDGFQYREPLGVVAGGCPFNFPAMVPMWMFPIAIAAGNTFVLKPSEKCPATATMIAEIMLEGGLPPGVLNVVHGGRETFEALIDQPAVRAVSFVGSTPAAEAVWQRATGLGKRCQALGGAKNYNLVLPDAPVEETVDAIIGSVFGCAGERCMATSVLVLVGDCEHILKRVIEVGRNLKLGDGMAADTAMGPLISAEHLARVEGYVQTGLNEGAVALLDGRGQKPEALPGGFFMGPTILDQVTPEMTIASDEIFGPVLAVMRADNLETAIEWANRSQYGNGASIFTASGGAARRFRIRISCGMVGINAGVPAPMAFFCFGGHKRSLFGDLKVQGRDGVAFYTQQKAVIERWFGTGETGTIWATD